LLLVVLALLLCGGGGGARETVRRLQMHNLLSDSPQAGSATFWSSAEPSLAHRQLSELWGERLIVHPMR